MVRATRECMSLSHVVDVFRGCNNRGIRKHRHDSLTEHGLGKAFRCNVISMHPRMLSRWPVSLMRLCPFWRLMLLMMLPVKLQVISLEMAGTDVIFHAVFTLPARCDMQVMGVGTILQGMRFLAHIGLTYPVHGIVRTRRRGCCGSW